MIQEATEILLRGNNLTVSQMETVMEEIMGGKADTTEVVSFLTGLNKKGETAEELTAAVAVMRKHVTRINAGNNIVLDTCGTGGDKKGTFNISTVVSFVASGAGLTVAKHGNRAVSSNSGSADVLEALGINIGMGKEKIEKCLKEIGIAFLFAQNLHPAMKHASEARKQIGKRTIFNILGPLTNPAGATHQLVGVFAAQWTEVLARVLANLGTIHAMVVHGNDGLDEITTTTSTRISEARKGRIESYEISPEDFGFKKAKSEELMGGTASDNADILLKILKGEAGPRRDIVILNAAAAIYVADKAESIKDGLKLASESIDSGAALKKLELLKEYSYEKS